MVDNSNVGPCGGGSGRGNLSWQPNGEEKGSSLGAKESACSFHIDDLGRKSITRGWSAGPFADEYRNDGDELRIKG